MSSLEEEEERLSHFSFSGTFVFPALGLNDFVYARSGLDPTDLDPTAPAFARSGLELFWQAWACPNYFFSAADITEHVENLMQPWTYSV